MNESATLLCFGLDGERMKLLEGMAVMQGMRVRRVMREEAAMPLEEILRRKEPEGGTPFPGMMLVMCHLSDPALDMVLKELSRGGPRTAIPLKAVLTSANRRFRPRELMMHRMSESEKIRNAGRK